MNYVIRAAKPGDLQSIYEMAKLTGGGFTNLPPEKPALRAKLERSATAFARTDDVLKPDLSAPGKVVVSARSRDAILWDQLPAFIDADGVHAVNLGTSMSAPYAARRPPIMQLWHPISTICPTLTTTTTA